MADNLNEKTNNNLSEEEMKKVSGGGALGQNGDNHPAQGYCRCNKLGDWGKICKVCQSQYGDYRRGMGFNFF